MSIHADDTPELLERAWREREETIYPQLFGSLGPGIYPLSLDTFRPFGCEEVDRRWLHCGVFASPPSTARSTWVYVSSGLSNPWWEADTHIPNVSGLGCELRLVLSGMADIGILHVQNVVAFQLLLAAGHYPGRGLLDSWDRIPLRQPVDVSGSELRWFLVLPPLERHDTFHLESGRVHLYTLLGITDDEATFARDHGGPELLELLRAKGVDKVTYPARSSVLSAA